MTEDKIARICWNAYRWQRPSGRRGKSTNKDTYEYRTGYGHEEWLLDTTKLINGWHYTFLQSIGFHREKYMGKIFNVYLYSINSENQTRWWIGCIRDVEVISYEEAKKVHKIYKRKGWLREMEDQLVAVNVETENLRQTKPRDFAVLKYKPMSLEVLSDPIEFSKDDSAVPANYYKFLDFIKKPTLHGEEGKFKFFAGHREKKSFSRSSYEKQSRQIDLVHNEMQTEIYKQLKKKYGKGRVGTENKSGGGSIDIVVKDTDGRFIFFEIKVTNSVKLCIREAIGQLLEYAYFPKAANPKKLIIVAQNKITKKEKAYLENLRRSFLIPIFYSRYNLNKGTLENIEH